MRYIARRSVSDAIPVASIERLPSPSPASTLVTCSADVDFAIVARNSA